jgi:hypothetical protein
MTYFISMQQNALSNINVDFKKLKKIELAKCGKFHVEAWQHRMKGEFDLMREKQDEALYALRQSRTYEYLNNVYNRL